MEEIVGQGKWTTTNHTKGRSSSKEGGVVYMVGLERSPLLWAPSGKWNNCNKCCSQLDQLKAALDEKCPELVNRKCIIFHQDTARPHVFWWPDKNCYSLAGKFWFTHPIHQTLHLWNSICLGLYKNSLNGKNFNSLEDCKMHLEQFFAQKDKKFWKDGIMKLPEKWQKVVEQKCECVVQ